MTYDYSSPQRPGPNSPLPWVNWNDDNDADLVIWNDDNVADWVNCNDHNDADWVICNDVTMVALGEL